MHLGLAVRALQQLRGFRPFPAMLLSPAPFGVAAHYWAEVGRVPMRLLDSLSSLRGTSITRRLGALQSPAFPAHFIPDEPAPTAAQVRQSGRVLAQQPHREDEEIVERPRVA